MDDLEARKVLKVFGMQVTGFMGRRRELTEQAATAILGQDRHTLTALLATLMTETSELHRRWLEVTNLVLQEEREAYSEMARLLEQAGQAESPPGRRSPPRQRSYPQPNFAYDDRTSCSSPEVAKIAAGTRPLASLTVSALPSTKTIGMLAPLMARMVFAVSRPE